MSFKNLFPPVFGKGGASSLDNLECLPAISNGDKWHNGSTGILHQLMQNMNNVSYQLDSSIEKVLKDHPEAWQLAIDCVTAAKCFVIVLIAFISQEYATWQTRGFSKKDAWQIVSQIIRRIFEDLQSARISTRTPMILLIWISRLLLSSTLHYNVMMSWKGTFNTNSMPILRFHLWSLNIWRQILSSQNSRKTQR